MSGVGHGKWQWRLRASGRVEVAKEEWVAAVTRLEQLRADGDLSATRVRLVADGLGFSTRTVERAGTGYELPGWVDQLVQVLI